MLIMDRGLKGIVDADGTLIREQPKQMKMTSLTCCVDDLI
jgi:hypothetical protein